MSDKRRPIIILPTSTSLSADHEPVMPLRPYKVSVDADYGKADLSKYPDHRVRLIMKKPGAVMEKVIREVRNEDLQYDEEVVNYSSELPTADVDSSVAISDDNQNSVSTFECVYTHDLKQKYIFGDATGVDNNCLIDSVYKLCVHYNLLPDVPIDTIGTLYANVRQKLVLEYNASPTGYLQHFFHGIPIFDALWTEIGLYYPRPLIGITAHSARDAALVAHETSLLNRGSNSGRDLSSLVGEIIKEDASVILLHLYNYGSTHYIPLYPI